MAKDVIAVAVAPKREMSLGEMCQSMGRLKIVLIYIIWYDLPSINSDDIMSDLQRAK